MPVIVNEIEVIAPASAEVKPQAQPTSASNSLDLTPHDLYGIKRKLLERRYRLITH